MKRNSTISPKTLKWLEMWTWKWKPTEGPPIPTPQIIKELSKFRPSKPVKLHRAEYVTKPSFSMPLKSYTHNREMASWMVEASEFPSQPARKLMSKLVKPEDILVDMSKIPTKYVEDYGLISEEVVLTLSRLKSGDSSGNTR